MVHKGWADESGWRGKILFSLLLLLLTIIIPYSLAFISDYRNSGFGYASLRFHQEWLSIKSGSIWYSFFVLGKILGKIFVFYVFLYAGLSFLAGEKDDVWGPVPEP